MEKVGESTETKADKKIDENIDDENDRDIVRDIGMDIGKNPSKNRIERPPKTFKILIVDDVPKNIQIAANILREEKYQIAFAQDGQTALEQIRTHLYDLVLLDIMMPGMDGITVCTELKKDPVTRDIPIIFLTAKTDVEDIISGFEAGAVDYVTKPFNGTELLARVKTHLELNHSREELKMANQELKTLSATKDKFLSIIAHDLNNPIQNLMLSSDILNNYYDKLETKQIKDIVSRFNSSSRLVADLLNNLLNWARSQQGKIRPKPCNINLPMLVKENIELLRVQAQSKKIGLSSDIAEGTSAYGDYNMIKTVIRNLISNAIKFTSCGGRVVVAAQGNGEWMEVSVTDTGVGIPDEEQDALFRIDTQRSTKGTNGEKGTGLGLILCKEFIEKNNGSIRVESDMGQGSRFIVTLPPGPTGE